MENYERKIIQMLPANGWRAIYADSSSPLLYTKVDLVCFALVEETNTITKETLNLVLPMDYAVDSICFCDVESYYLGLEGPSSSPIDWTKEAEEYFVELHEQDEDEEKDCDRI